MVDDGDGFDKGCTRQVGEAEIAQYKVHLVKEVYMVNKVHMVNTNTVGNMIMTHGMMRIHWFQIKGYRNIKA